MELPSFTYRLKFYTELNSRSGSEVCEEIKDILRDCYCHVLSPPRVTSRNQASYESPQCRVSVQVEAGLRPELLRGMDIQKKDTWATLVALAIQHNWCKESAFSLHDQIWLSFEDTDKSVVEDLMNLDKLYMSSFGFGFLPNSGVYCQAYEYNCPETHSGGNRRRQPNQSSNNNNNPIFPKRKLSSDSPVEGEQQNGNLKTEEPGIQALFEHLQRRLRITSFRMAKVDKPCGATEDIQLEIYYPSIVQVIVDAGLREDSKNCISVFLQLRYPPKVFKKPCVPPNSGSRPRFQRVWQFGGCSQDHIGMSYVVKLGLNVETQIRQRLLWEFLSKLKERAKIDIWFAAIKEDKLSPMLAIPRLQSYACTYALEALLSRGYRVAHQLDERFIRRVQYASQQNALACEYALNNLVNAFDEHRVITLLPAFDALYKDHIMPDPDNVLPGLIMDFELPDPERYVKVRKLIITPTRILLQSPEVMLKNHVTREYDPEFALRVSFRDDDASKYYFNRSALDGEAEEAVDDEANDEESSGISSISLEESPAKPLVAVPGTSEFDMFEQMIASKIRGGLEIGGRKYEFLGASNSQMRDHGCYFYAKNLEGLTAPEIRNKLGDFSGINVVAKYMARMGQRFTQTQVGLELPIPISETRTMKDVIGGDINPVNGKKYTFSDGVGTIALSVAKKIYENIDELKFIPSAFQIRYGGAKGMLTLHKLLDLQLAKGYDVRLINFRESMVKFQTQQPDEKLEIVKWSQPNEKVTLNKPLIMILDQQAALPKEAKEKHDNDTVTLAIQQAASLKEAKEKHDTVTLAIRRYLEKQMFEIADMLLFDSRSAEALLNKTSLNIDFVELKNARFLFTKEPFFRGMLLAIHEHGRQNLAKCKIEIPRSQGRTMFGVMDEFGVLTYGQVHVRITTSAPRAKEKTYKTLTGKVMVTKNPSVVPGDVRILQCVANSQLEHLVDVIVFPKHGKRPHPNEMAGSDLDGDEYAVYWDEDLMFTHNAEAMHFPESEPERLDRPIVLEDIVDFFRKYVSFDQLGTMAKAHLTAADKDEGINSDVCRSIAEKVALAVDFAKSGKPPESLTKRERQYEVPDFNASARSNKPVYCSRRLLGQLHRKIKVLDDLALLVEQSSALLGHEMDPDLTHEGWELFKDKAVLLRDKYNFEICSLMDQYGLKNESQLLSGHMTYIRNRLSEGEKEDFSFYKTEQVIADRLRLIRDRYRRHFFDGAVVPLPSRRDEDDENKYEFTLDQKRKAAAWYIVTYSQAPSYGENCGFFSFPWVVWDVLKVVKEMNVFADLKKSMDRFSADALLDHLYAEIQTHTAKSEDTAYFDAAKLLFVDVLPHSPLLQDATDKCSDLRLVLMVLMRWCEEEKVNWNMRDVQLEALPFCLLFVTFATTPLLGCPSEHRVENWACLVLNPSRIALLLLEFVKSLASESFRTSGDIKLVDGSTFCPKLYTRLHRIALKTYHHIALSGQFCSLRLNSASTAGRAWDDVESEPLVVTSLENLVTNNDADIALATAALKYWTHCRKIRVKVLRNAKVIITAAGNAEARQHFLRIALSDNLWHHIVCWSSDNHYTFIEDNEF